MLVENDGEVEGVIDLLHAGGLNHWEVLGRGHVGDVLGVPCVRERLRTVVAGGVLGRERSPNVSCILPLSVHHDLEGRGRAKRAPRQREFRCLVVGPPCVEFNRRGLVNPCAAVEGDVLVVGLVFQNEPVVGSERKGVCKAPIPSEDRTAFRGVEVNEKIGSLYA